LPQRSTDVGPGVDLTTVECNRQWLALGRVAEHATGTVPSIDLLEAEDAEGLQAWIAAVTEARGAELLVTAAAALRP